MVIHSAHCTLHTTHFSLHTTHYTLQAYTVSLVIQVLSKPVWREECSRLYHSGGVLSYPQKTSSYDACNTDLTALICLSSNEYHGAYSWRPWKYFLPCQSTVHCHPRWQGSFQDSFLVRPSSTLLWWQAKQTKYQIKLVIETSMIIIKMYWITVWYLYCDYISYYHLKSAVTENSDSARYYCRDKQTLFTAYCTFTICIETFPGPGGHSCSSLIKAR